VTTYHDRPLSDTVNEDNTTITALYIPGYVLQYNSHFWSEEGHHTLFKKNNNKTTTS